MLVAIMVALPGGPGFAILAAAEPLTVPVSGETPENFESSCFQAGGQPFEIHDSSGGIATSVCEFSDGGVNECNWSAGTCSYGIETRVQPTPRSPLDDVSVDPDDLGGILDDSTAPPAEETAAPATEPAAEKTAEPATEPAAEKTAEPATEPAAEETADGARPTDVSTAEASSQTGPAGGSAVGDQSGQSASAEEPASLTILAFACEPGYDPFALDADPAQECSEPTDGVPFALTGDGTDMTRSAGDDGDGTATFQELAPGVYRLTGQPPSWGGVAFVHDCASSVRSFDDAAFFPLAMVGPTGTIGLTLLPGETLECGWYQVAAGS